MSIFLMKIQREDLSLKKIISKKGKLYTDWMTCHGLTGRPQYIIGSVLYNLYTWEFRQQIARQAARISVKFSNLALFISSPEPTFLRISLNRDPREMMGRREIFSVITNCKVNYFNIVLKSTTKLCQTIMPVSRWHFLHQS